MNDEISDSGPWWRPWCYIAIILLFTIFVGTCQGRGFGPSDIPDDVQQWDVDAP